MNTMHLSLTFVFDHQRIVRVDRLQSITVQSYTFDGQDRPETALVVNNEPYQLARVSEIVLTPHAGRG